MNSSERVVASNVFEEADFPHMVRGRVALLGDGTYIHLYIKSNRYLFLVPAAHSMTSFFGQVSKLRSSS